jgi:hypothetical protein
MHTHITLPDRRRDLRLDLFRGFANWAIFLDHIPGNTISWITMRNFGFSDAADLFVFISGYTASVVYGRAMFQQGFASGATRLFQRVWQLYTAHIIVFVAYVVAVGYLANKFLIPDLTERFNTAEVMDGPIEALRRGLLLQFKPVNLDVLPLYIVLMGCFAPVLWLMLRLPNTTLAGSLILYALARHFGWNFPNYPSGVWWFNPFAWQFLFVLGAWFALGGSSALHASISNRRLVIFGGAFLVFACFMTLAAKFDTLGNLLPAWLHDTFIPNDKVNLAPYRVLHLAIIFMFATWLISPDWRGLQWKIFDPLIKCGQHSLVVFCCGLFLSFFAWFVLSTTPTIGLTRTEFQEQLLISLSGLAIMTLIAYYFSWSKGLEKESARSEKPAKDKIASTISAASR